MGFIMRVVYKLSVGIKHCENCPGTGFIITANEGIDPTISHQALDQNN